MSAAQNLLLADELEQSGDTESATEIRSMVEQENVKAHDLADLRGDDTVFGMPVAYLREFDRINTVSLHLDDGLPVLVLQGEKDRQVSMMDFALRQEGLAGHPHASLISYPALNHLSGEYTSDPDPSSPLFSV